MVRIRETVMCGCRKPYLGVLFSMFLLSTIMFVEAEDTTCLHRYTKQLMFNPNCNPFHHGLMRLECVAEVPLNDVYITIGWFLNCNQLNDGMMVNASLVSIEQQTMIIANVLRLRSILTISDISNAFAGGYTCNLIGSGEYIPSDKFQLRVSMDYLYLWPCPDGNVFMVPGTEKCADITENMTIPASLICEDTPSTSIHFVPTSTPSISSAPSLIHTSTSTSSSSSISSIHTVITETNSPTSLGVPSPSEKETTSPSSTQDLTSTLCISSTPSLIHTSSFSFSTLSIHTVITATTSPTSLRPSVGVLSPSEEETISPSSTWDLTSTPSISSTPSLIHTFSSSLSTSSIPAVITTPNSPTFLTPSIEVPSPSIEETSSPFSMQDQTSVWLYVVVAVAAVFFMIIIVLAIVYLRICIRRTKSFNTQTPTSTIELEKFSKDYEQGLSYRDNYCHNAIRRELPKVPSQPPQQSHIEQLKEELEHKDMLFLKNHITLTKVIGEGESGLVYRGHIRGMECVAVKTGKALVSECQKEQLLKEVFLMMTFEHLNVMPLIGMCFDGEVPLLIMPFMSDGSVLDYVRKNVDTLNCTENSSELQRLDAKKKCMDMCHQIAKGMSYLAMKKFVHRDLAARNCMIDGLTNGVIKVADFGMAEDMYSTNYYKYDSEGREERVPLKWMAPETIKNNIFSESSDVWSYGVTCWEVFTCGRVPYSGVPVMTLLSELHSGQRLDRPSNVACSDDMWDLIKSCWSIDCKERPTFNDIVKGAADLLDCDSSYIKL